MAVVTTVPNHLKYLLATGLVDFSNATAGAFKIILMNTTFAFDKDTHALLADVTADQIATQFGYVQNNKALTGVTLTENDTTDKATIVWDDITFTAVDGSIGPTGAAIIYYDIGANDPIVMCIDFGADFTVPATFSFIIQAPEIDLS